MNEKWLIRLMDANKENMITAYFTENPEQSLKTFYFCKEHGIPINIPNSEDENYRYADKTAGSISEIEIGFGNRDSYCYIDIWMDRIW